MNEGQPNATQHHTTPHHTTPVPHTPGREPTKKKPERRPEPRGDSRNHADNIDKKQPIVSAVRLEVGQEEGSGVA